MWALFAGNLDGGKGGSVDPVVRSERLLVSWDGELTKHQIKNTTFGLEVEFENTETKGRMWAVFMYASIDENTRTEQWQEVITRSEQWETQWLLGGDFTKIRMPHEKKWWESQN